MTATTVTKIPAMKQIQKPKGRWGARYTYVLMAFLGTINMMALRVNLSVGLVAMVNSTTISTNVTSDDQCPMPDESQYNEHDHSEDSNGEFDWDEKLQGLVLGAFYYGFCITQVPGGILAGKYGGKNLYGGGVLLSGLITLLYPIAANTNVYLLTFLRALQGLAEGVCIPALYVMNSKWLPDEEKGFLSTIIFSGMTVGVIIFYPVCGVLAEELHWEYVFYVPAAIAILWALFWHFLISNTPRDCRSISPEELAYIEASSGSLQDLSVAGKKTLAPPPMLKILCSKPFMVLAVAQMGNYWGYYTLMSGTPLYLSNILHFPLEQNGFLSALPYICNLIVAIPSGWLSDKLISSGKLSKLSSRKLFSAVGNYGPALGMVALSFVGCNRTLAIVALCGSVGMDAASFSGFMLNHFDLSPNYTGTLYGIANTLANVTGFISPLVTGILTNGNQTLTAWRTVFLLGASILLLTNTFFMVFGTDKVQPWNDVFNVVQATADPEKGSDNKNNNNETSVVNEDMERRMRAKEAEINAAVSTVYHVEIVEIH